MKWSIGLPFRDSIHLELELDGFEIKSSKLSGIGCMKLLDLLVQWRTKLNGDVRELPLPQSNDHSALLLRQLILQVQGKWSPPYQEEELCHCRAIPTAIVNTAITSGCHTPESVSKKTSASTACGTCRRDVAAQIEYFLNSSKKAA